MKRNSTLLFIIDNSFENHNYLINVNELISLDSELITGLSTAFLKIENSPSDRVITKILSEIE